MRPIKRILVAVKSPEATGSAGIAKATQLARARGAHVDLLFGVDAPLGAQEFALYRQKLEPLARQVRDHGVSVSVTAEIGHPVHEAILRRAEITCADLIVIDCHAGHPIAPSLLQLTDWELARLSPVPLLIVKRQRAYRHPKVLAAVDPTHAYSKPLELDAQILACGAQMSELLHGTLHAVHAYVPALSAAESATAVTAGRALRIDVFAAADARKALSQVLQSTAIPPERRHVMAGHPADIIRQVVAQTEADIVVMGSMSRSGLRRLLIGNTADKLLYRLPCDLLLIKPCGLADLVPRERCASRVFATAGGN